MARRFAGAMKWGIFGIMVDIFACRKCHAVYALTRHQHPPDLAPFCDVCNSAFPPKELGEWLTYQRAEPEDTVKAWLTSAPNVPSVPNVQSTPSAPSTANASRTSVALPSARLSGLAGRMRTESLMARIAARARQPQPSAEEPEPQGGRDRLTSS